MPSLVKKWQSIQKELDEEEKSSSSDEDRDQLNKKSIEEWKHQQILTYVRLNMATVKAVASEERDSICPKMISVCFYRGKASKNANFEALPEDWRDRVKRRKMMNT